jgi:hypothetical protein
MYPKFENSSSPERLLFDIGYSYALIESVNGVLKEIAECGDYPVAVGKAIEAIEDFQESRLQLRSEVYASAEPALAIERRLAALDRIIEAADAFTLPPNILSETLADAILEGKRATGKGLPEIRFRSKD